MDDLLLKSWWMLALRGVVALLFGALAWLWPGLTLLWLVALFAAYALLGGGAAVIAALKNRKSNEDWWMILLLGLVGLGAGVITLVNPQLTTLVLVLVMGANALLTGILEIVTAVRLRKLIHGEWLLMMSGLVSILFGVLVFLFPTAGVLALVWLISFYAFVTGILLLSLAVRARKWQTATGRHGPDQWIGAA